MTSLSVLVPVYNEEYLVAESLGRLEVLGDSPYLTKVEVIVVDDCSTDDTPQVLDTFAAGRGSSKLTWRFLRHERNGGKGAAIRTALAQATCELTVIHDADSRIPPARPVAAGPRVRRGRGRRRLRVALRGCRGAPDAATTGMSSGTSS